MNISHFWCVAFASLMASAQAAQLTLPISQTMKQSSKDLSAHAILRPYKLGSGKCLQAGGVVTIENCSGSRVQNWKFLPRGQFVSQGGTCLTLIGASATVAACRNDSRFIWEPTEEGTIVHSSGKCLTAGGQVNRAGVRVLVAPCKGGANQIWK